MPIRERAVVGPVLCHAEPSLDLVASLPAQSVRVSARMVASSRSRQGLRPGERVEPAVERRHPTGGQQRDGDAHHERARAGDVPAGDRVVDGALDLPRAPRTRATLGHAARERRRDRWPRAGASGRPRRDGGTGTRTRSRRGGRGRSSSARSRRASRRSRSARARRRRGAQRVSRARTSAS